MVLSGVGLKPHLLTRAMRAGESVPGAEARTYPRGKSNGNGRSRFPAGMTTRKAKARANATAGLPEI
jgi:hypothetical protein